jgi:hypothetical protein
MGHYTGFRVKAKIKPQYQSLVENMISLRDEDGLWSKLVGDYPFLKELAESERGDSLFGWYTAYPIGREYDYNARDDGGEHIPAWEKNNPEWQMSFQDGILTFQSSFKNLGDPITLFAKVLEIISEEILVCERRSEDEHYSREFSPRGEWEIQK